LVNPVMSQNPHFYLASSSPRRKELLQQLQVDFSCLDSQIDESRQSNESPYEYVKRMAEMKAQAGWHHPQRKLKLPVIGADTSIAMDNDIIGKPENDQHAVQILHQLSGGSHEVLTAVSVFNDKQELHCLNISEVSFRELTTAEIETYVHTGEPRDKAGAYAIQGLGALFVSHLRGSYSGVMGLPLFETAELLARMGVNIMECTKNLNHG